MCSNKAFKRLNLLSVGTVSASHSVANGGGTGGEFPINLLKAGEEAWNKWCEIEYAHPVVEMKFTEYVSFQGIGFKSANDCPHRDPDTIVVKNYDFRSSTWYEIGIFEPRYDQRW